MPYWSLAEWRARIGSSWCALGRPHKTKSSVGYGARIMKKEPTLNRVVTMIILLTILVGVNIGVRGLVAAGYHHQLICLWHQYVSLLNSALVFTLVLKTFVNSSLKRSRWYSVICGTNDSSISASFLLYMVFLIMKLIYPAVNLQLWLVPAVAMMHTPDMERILSVLWRVIDKQVEIFDLKCNQNGNLVVKRREDLRILYVMSCMLDIALSVAASVIASLLLLSGDIEQNPGPDLDYNSVDATQVLDEDDFLEVLEAILSIKSTYFALGQSLRLRAADLRSIKEKYPNKADDRQALSDTLELWLQQKYKVEKFGLPTWRMLVEAVNRKAGGNNHELAKEIASEHLATGATATQLSQSIEKKTEIKDVPVSGDTAAQPSQFHKEKIETEDGLKGATDTQLRQPCERETETDLADDTCTDGCSKTQTPLKSDSEPLRDSHLSVYNLREVLDRTWPYRAGWMYIGIELGINFSTLEATKMDCMMAGGVGDCLTKMITIWLRNTDPKPTQLALDKALQSDRVSRTAAHDIVTAKDKHAEYTAYLKSLYKANIQACFHDKDLWPPPVTNKVFRLAMIEAERVNRREIDDNFVKSTITGKVDDILQMKAPVELENIFKERKDRQRKVLIEGAPGCGKSTLSQYICHQWAEGKLFQEYKQMILVRLREQEVQNAKCVADMLPRRNDSMGAEMEEVLSTCDGQDILFVFDGWDELPKNAASRSIITNILNSNILHECSFIITSRPVASMDLLSLVKFNSRVELLGFTKDELQKYFAKCLDNDDSKVKILQQRIKENPVVAGSCYLPLNASILVHLFKCDDELPETQFDIFSALTCNCIYRHLKKITKDEVSVIESLDELPQSIAALFEQICEIAYEGVMDEKIVFKLKDDFNTLGLLQGVESFAKSGMLSRSYNFLHLSIQELLAAVHMATQLDDKQQVVQFTKLFGRPRFSAVFRFYAAKTKLKTLGIKDIVIQAVKKCLEHNEVTELTSDSDYSHRKLSGFNFGHKQQPLLVNLLHCLYEAHDKDLCLLVATEFKQKLDLSNINLDPADCLSIEYILTYCKDFEVDLYQCNIDDDCCKTLFKQDGDYSGLLSLGLHNNSIGAEGAKSISKAMKTMTKLQKLYLYSNSIGAIGAKAISEAMKTMTNLQKLYLSSNSIGDDGAKAISEAMRMTTAYNLKELHLDNNSIGNDGAKAISEAMKTMTTLKELHLHNNSIGDDGAKAMSKAMKMVTNLEELLLHNNSIGADGAKAISESIKMMTNLKELHLHNNSIGADGAKAISESIKMTTKLQKLYLSSNSIGADGAKAISEAMKMMTTLKELGLSNNSIGDDGAKAISEVMKTMTNLKELYLYSNSISDDGANAISEAMKTMTNLQKLYIFYNSIGEAGTAALSAAGEQSSTMILGLDSQN